MRAAPTSIALVVALLLLVAVQQLAVVPGTGQLAIGLQNAMHGPWFAVVTTVCYTMVRRLRPQADALRAAALIAVLLALATEGAQIPTGRNAEWLDVLLDLLGAAAALLVLAARAGRIARRRSYAAASLLLLATLAPAILAAAVTWHRGAIFPELVDFSAPRFGGLLTSSSRVRVVGGDAGPGVRALEVELADEDWPGVYLPEPEPDWRGFDALVVEVIVPDAPLELNVSIRLRGDPREHVYRTFALPPGNSRLRMELRELFDPAATEVSSVVVYSTRAYAGRRLVIARIALE